MCATMFLKIFSKGTPTTKMLWFYNLITLCFTNSNNLFDIEKKLKQRRAVQVFNLL